MAELSFEDAFKKITESPSIMSKISELSKEGGANNIEDVLPKLMSILSSEIGENEPQCDSCNTEKTDTPPTKVQNSADFSQSPLSLPLQKISNSISKNSSLLCALKPYLSKERADVIDSILKIAQVTELMKLAR